LLDRIGLLSLNLAKVKALGYSYEELKMMMDKSDPFALKCL
jgi:hypothetical protein